MCALAINEETDYLVNLTLSMYTLLDIHHLFTTLLGNFWPTVSASKILEIVFCKTKKFLLCVTKQNLIVLVEASVTRSILLAGSSFCVHSSIPALKFDNASLELIHVAIKIGRSRKAITLIVAYLLH